MLVRAHGRRVDRDVPVDLTGRIRLGLDQAEGIDAGRHLAEQGCEPQAGWVAKGHLAEFRARMARGWEDRHLIA
ncbi:hypothetical protein [Streptacidiphilus melanogenes]|uniref:hypothetical protein n=1 Tax=Streptacidiphilus melanogenes TaxID=411235 RepID=UPI000AE2CD01